MENKNISPRVLIGTLLLFSVLIGGCKKENLTLYEGVPAVNFDIISIVGATRSYSKDYNFLLNPEESYIEEIDVSIMGIAVDRDRHFKVEVVDDENTTATADQYQILEGIVPAGEFKGKLYVKLNKTPDLQERTLSLKMKIVDSEDFKVGHLESSEFILNWNDRAVPPAINVYVRTFFIANWSTQAYRIFTQTTGKLDFLVADYQSMGEAGTIALSTKFGDYIKQWNLDHPKDVLVHDDGPLEGQTINPVHYTRSKYD